MRKLMQYALYGFFRCASCKLNADIPAGCELLFNTAKAFINWFQCRTVTLSETPFVCWVKSQNFIL